jgi:hypothetical protein
VAQIVGLTHEPVRQVESTALAKLRHPSAGAAGGPAVLAIELTRVVPLVAGGGESSRVVNRDSRLH